MKRSEPPNERSGCDTTNPPPGYNIERKGGKTQWQKCKEYWNKARAAVEQRSFRNDLEHQSAIKIIKNRKRNLGIHGLRENDEFICYNQNFLGKRGWCEIEGSTGVNPKWGICSTSCKHYSKFKGQFQAPGIVPVTYNEMDLMAWKCQIDESFRRYYLDRGFTNAALLCSRPIYPEQKIWEFERSYKIPGVQERFEFTGGTNVELQVSRSKFYTEDHDKMKLPYGNKS